MAISQGTVFFPFPVERVWGTVTDRTRTAWRSDLAQVDILDETHFVERTKSGYATHFTVTAWEPLRRWAFTMENDNLSGSWEGRFEEAPGGTRLTYTETVTAKRWWIRPFVPGYLKKQQKGYWEDLKRALQKESYNPKA